MDKFNLNVWTAKLAIGSLWLVSVFLTICGFYNIFPFVEAIVATDTWQVVVALPLLVMAYLTGGIVIYVSKYATRHSRDAKEISDFVLVSKLENEFLITRYESLRYEIEFFQACLPTILFLALSVLWSSIRVLKVSAGERWMAILLAVIILFTIPIIYRMVIKLRNDIKVLVSEAISRNIEESITHS